MALFKKQRKSIRPVADNPGKPHQPVQQPSYTTEGPELPGVAGYHGIEQLPRGAMPLSRFKYVRPDGKE